MGTAIGPGTSGKSRAARVLHLLGTGKPGGTEAFVRDLLVHCDRDAFRPSVCILGESGSVAGELARLSGELVVLDPAHRGRLAAVLRLAQLLRRGRFDILHAHSGGMRIKRAARLFGCRRVITHFHSITDSGIALLRSGDPALSPFLEQAARGSDRLIACSDWMAGVLSNHLPHLRDRIDRVYNGVDVARFRASSGATADTMRLRATSGIGEGSFVAGFAGRLVRQKGLDFLLDAAARTRERHPDVCFLIIGDGPLRSTLESRVRDQSLSNVRFVGEVPDIRPMMSLFDVTVMPSEWEPFGIVALESMAMGKPVIASDVDGIPEVVENEATGLLVRFGDVDGLVSSILRLRADLALRTRLGDQGRRRAEDRFDARATAAGVERVYRAVLARD